MMMPWNCVGCDASGTVAYELDTTMQSLLCEIALQHERSSLDHPCPLTLDGYPQISIWEERM